MASLGLLLIARDSIAEMVRLARLAEESGFDSVSVADERFYREVYSTLSVIAGEVGRVKLGPCVTDPFARHPALTAMAIATLDEISGGRAVLGIGAGVSGFAELGITRTKPPRAMRESIELIRALLRGETVDYRGEVVRLSGGRLSFAPLRSEVPIYVASNGPVGQRMAGAVADGAMMAACGHPDAVRRFRASVEAGARSTGRAPASVEIIVRLNACIAESGERARDAVRPTVARYLADPSFGALTPATAHLALPPEPLAAVRGASYSDGVKPYLPLLPLVTDEHVDAFTLAGTRSEVAAHLTALIEAGADSLSVMPFGGEGASVEDTVRSLGREVWPAVQAAVANRPQRSV